MYRGIRRRVPDVTRTRQLPPRQRLLAAADDLFRRVGIRGVGVEQIAAEAGTNKMTLYRHFASKDELITAWMRDIIAQKEAAWDEIVAQHPDDPAGQLVYWSRRNAKQLAQMEGRGSTIQNVLAELPESDHPARRLIEQHRRREHRRIVELCRKAGFPEPQLAADEFYFLLEGAKCCVLSMGLKRVGEHLMRLVDSMVATKGARASGNAR
jgi:AcrR family transcriptional regulator